MLAKESQIQVDEKYNLAYILDPTDEKKMAIQSLKELTGVETKIILDMKNFDKSYAKWSDMDIIDKVSVPDFVKLIRNCNFLLTDSHHGVCFGMIYHKKFWLLGIQEEEQCDLILYLSFSKWKIV